MLTNKKLNNKGITTVEVLISFILLAIVSVSLYSTVSSYRNKQSLESYKEKIYTYKNLLTKEIEQDLLKNTVTNISYNDTKKEFTFSLKNEADDSIIKKMRIIPVSNESEVDSISYGTEGDLLKYPLPDLGNYEDVDGSEKKVLKIDSAVAYFDAETKIFNMKIKFNHVDFGSRYDINIVCEINSGRDIDINTPEFESADGKIIYKRSI